MVWQVIVDDMENNRVYELLCGRWLAKDEDDGAIWRDLVVAGGPGGAPAGKQQMIFFIIFTCYRILDD